MAGSAQLRPGGLASALAAAELAVLLLRPRPGVDNPEKVDVRSYFTGAELQRARRFRRCQRLLGLAYGAVESGTLLLIARRARPSSEPLSAAVGAAGLSLVLTVAPLPIAALSHALARRAGLAVQGFGAWGKDLARASAVGVGLSAGAAAAAVWLLERLGRQAWAAGAALATVASVLMGFVAPLLYEPLFNDFTPLPAGPLRDSVLELCGRADVSVANVLVADASRRTTAANAYVSGLGSTRRVVLFDTLLKHFSAAEIELVVAHELSHVRHRDIARSVAFLAIVSPAAMHCAQRLAEGFAGEPPPIAALALAGGTVAVPLGAISAQLSRRVEARADRFALELTGASEAFVSFTQRIVRQNLADPAPSPLLALLGATHPRPIDRIGAAVAFTRSGRRTPANS